MFSAYINGIGAFFPNQPVTNDEMENVLGMIQGKPSRSKKRILNNNGIATRFVITLLIRLQVNKLTTMLK